ncbi:hypothetical protein E2C01_048044 [Portunus trituberculatus]|uniref:Uncharacterized protein n=1 Tax=Portunus trituberculatus TaxID=210409 RepID=A0A5B7G9J6_PORTR|nr:hypothetical protein [Portunus trituberculatus]
MKVCLVEIRLSAGKARYSALIYSAAATHKETYTRSSRAEAAKDRRHAKPSHATSRLNRRYRDEV